MGYDLEFHGGRTRGLRRAAFEAWFRDRPNYIAADDGAAAYENDDTGVYFRFEFRPRDDGPRPLPVASFRINYGRPHVFGLEAEPELAAFVGHFGFAVDDPQIHGMGYGRYSREGFLRPWNHGNAFSYETVADGGFVHGDHCLPAATIGRVWRWNFGRSTLLDRRDGAPYVPTIMYVEHAGKPVTCGWWQDGSRTVFPETEYIVACRGNPASGDADARHLTLVPFADLLPLLGDHGTRSINGLTCRVPPGGEPGEAVLRWFRNLVPAVDDLRPIPFETVLDEETMQAARERLRRRK